MEGLLSTRPIQSSFNICLYIFNKKVNRDIIYALRIQIRIQIQIQIFKASFNQWWIQIFKYLNKMTLKYYLYLYLCYFRSTNIFRYSFGKYVASKYILVFVWYIMRHLNIFGYLFLSILWYSLITGIQCMQHVECVQSMPSMLSGWRWQS